MRALCTICTDLFDEIRSIVTTKCGHVFHEECIYQWIDNSSTCPECRQKATFSTVSKLYFNVSTSEQNSADNLENQVHALQAKIAAKDQEIIKIRNEKNEIQNVVRAAEDKASLLQQEVYSLKAEVRTLRLVAKDLKKTAAKVPELEQMNLSLGNKLEHYHNIENIISGTQKDVEDIIAASSGSGGLKQLATYCSILKRELRNSLDSKGRMRTEICTLQKDISLQSINLRKQVEEIKQLREQLQDLEQENLSLIKEKSTFVRNLPSNNSGEATVSYESPAPERLKRASDFDEETVTPVPQRTVGPPPTKKKGLKVVIMRSGMSAADFRPAVSTEEKLLAGMKAYQMKQKDDEDSIIRVAYNGLGGHEKYICHSPAFYKKSLLKKK